MSVIALFIAAAFLGHARAGVVELNCGDNATCIDNMAKEFVRSVRQQKTVRVFDVLTVEPLGTRQARSNEGLLPRFLQSHAFSFDWNDYTFRLKKTQDRSDALDLEVFESRTAKDISEEVPKSKSKVEEEEEEDDKKSPKHGIIKRRAKKKIMQAVIPMLFGMKSAGAFMFAMAVVTVLTLKAFVASKLALIVTIGMAMKKLYESYSLGAGLQNHPYLYSQYPIDFPSASSHAYSVSGVSPQFPPEMYNPTALAAHSQTELLQHNDASAQQSQQAPTLQLLNSTRASERWDGKSKLQKLIEPIVNGIKSYIDPIANMFYAMPATFRGLNSDVTTMKTTETENEAEETVKKPREILVAQPRYIAQRKMNYRKIFLSRPKKYTELKVDLDKLKRNKDLYDYIKTKKYKHNYQHTYYYPRVKYFVNPSTFTMKPKTNRLVPYKGDAIPNIPLYNVSSAAIANFSDWQPIIVPTLNVSAVPANATTNLSKSRFQNSNNKKRKRVKRNTEEATESDTFNFDRNLSNTHGRKQSKDFYIQLSGRGFLNFIQKIVKADPLTAMIDKANHYTKSAIKNSLKTAGPPKYYTLAYDLVLISLDVIDGLVQVHQAMSEYFFGDVHKSIHKKKKGTHAHAHKPHKPHKKKPAKNKPHPAAQGDSNDNYDKAKKRQ